MIIFKTELEELPPCCELCPYSKPYGLVGDRFCKITKAYFTGNVKPPYKERPDECPLTELPKKYDIEEEKKKPHDRDYDWEFEGGYNACLDEILGKQK